MEMKKLIKPYVPKLPKGVTKKEYHRKSAVFMGKVYIWVACAIAIEGSVAFYLFQTGLLRTYIEADVAAYEAYTAAAILVRIILALTLIKFVPRWNSLLSAIIFFIYLLAGGLLSSFYLAIFTTSSVYGIFVATSAIFALFSLYGFITKRDLGAFGKLVTILVGIVSYAIVMGFALDEDALFWIGIIVGLPVFMFATISDTQKIKISNNLQNEGSENDNREIINGAFVLYLDFINIFFRSLRTMGKRR